MEDRIIELETKVAYQDRTIEALNEVVTRQQDQIDRLEERLRSLRARVQSAIAEPDIPDEPPPHY